MGTGDEADLVAGNGDPAAAMEPVPVGTGDAISQMAPPVQGGGAAMEPVPVGTGDLRLSPSFTTYTTKPQWSRSPWGPETARASLAR